MLPVLGVPIPATTLDGLDSLLSIVQMPKGVPVGTLAIGEPGAINAALLATAIVSTHRADVARAPARVAADSAPTTCSPTRTFPHGDGGDGVIPPGSTIGILGGGQLGRMTAMAARTLGYHVHVLDPDANCAASAVADRVVAAQFDDADAAARSRAPTATSSRSRSSRSASTRSTPRCGTRPCARAPRFSPWCRIASRQKRWLADDTDFPSATIATSRRSNELAAAQRDLGALVRESESRRLRRPQPGARRRRRRGRARVGRRSASARRSPNARSISSRRSPSSSRDGRAARFASIRRRSTFTSDRFSPGPCFPLHSTPRSRRGPKRSRATSPTRSRSKAFSPSRCSCSTTTTLLVNELAPRPHNSFHETEVACSTSQFEQIVRAVCDLPLGDPRALRPGRSHNLFGDLWLEHDGPPPFERALARPGVRLHLYGKRGPAPGTQDGPSLRRRRHRRRRTGARSRRRRRARRTTNLRGFACRDHVCSL